MHKTAPNAPESDTGNQADQNAAERSVDVGVSTCFSSALKGTVTVRLGSDVTAPVDTQWNATR